jgi:hypothetical protein
MKLPFPPCTVAQSSWPTMRPKLVFLLIILLFVLRLSLPFPQIGMPPCKAVLYLACPKVDSLSRVSPSEYGIDSIGALFGFCTQYKLSS